VVNNEAGLAKTSFVSVLSQLYQYLCPDSYASNRLPDIHASGSCVALVRMSTRRADGVKRIGAKTDDFGL
jgi:hypothetical protein